MVAEGTLGFGVLGNCGGLFKAGMIFTDWNWVRPVTALERRQCSAWNLGAG